MAVDLTTGSYDEDGIFSKHNESPKSSEKLNAEEICSLKNFRTDRIIKECLHEKSVVVEGHFAGDDKPAIIVIEKLPFEVKDIAQLFTANCRLELKLRNNVYANYHVYPPSGFNGFDIRMIYPAKEEDFSEFVNEPLRIVKETAVIYNSVVLPHFQLASSSKSFLDSHPCASTIYEESDCESGFILLENNPEKCFCTTKHIRAVCIVKKKSLLSLRDLTAEDIPFLYSLKQKCLEKLSAKFCLPDSKFLSYVLYPPEHFPFHVIFETVEKDESVPAEKAHHLETLICNLQLVPEYYKKVTLVYSLAEKNSLLKKIHGITNNEQ